MEKKIDRIIVGISAIAAACMMAGTVAWEIKTPCEAGSQCREQKYTRALYQKGEEIVKCLIIRLKTRI